jgi:hypothetical protein
VVGAKTGAWLTGLVLAASCSTPRASVSSEDRATIDASELDQVVIIDAGSSGTRARVFQYLDDRPESLVDLDRECDNDEPMAVDIVGVLNSYACVRDLLIDPANTPVLVYATGGMRTLAEQQPEQAERRHAEVIAALHEQGVVEVESRTITGSDEALYQWIGVNHQERRLGSGSGSETATIVEFGGASVQVAFELAPEQAVPESLASDELVTIELGGIEHRVVARSYLHCGMNEAREGLAGPSCFPSDCATSPICAALLPHSLVGVPTTGGPMPACEAPIAHALETDAACTALRDLPPALPNRPIRLVSAVASVFEALAVVDEGHVDLARARVVAERVCGSSWTQLDALPGGARRYRGSLCFTAAHALLVLEAWGVGAGDVRPGIGDLDDSWTWGVARERLDRR